MITQEELKKLLKYNPETGIFIWRITKSTRAYAGDIAGCQHNNYIDIRINAAGYRAHRLAWLYMYGVWPNVIDHINQDPLDNKISNLRDVDRIENGKNRKKSINNVSGVTGVYWFKITKKWRAQIIANKKYVHLGFFDDKFEAICARLSANNKYGFLKNHGV